MIFIKNDRFCKSPNVFRYQLDQKLKLSLSFSLSLSLRSLSVSTSPLFLSGVLYLPVGGGRVVQWCWVNFQCRGVLLIWIIVGQGPTVLAVSAGGGGLDIFSLVYHFSVLSPSLWETARYRLKYCLKGPLSPIQPTNQLLACFGKCIQYMLHRL